MSGDVVHVIVEFADGSTQVPEAQIPAPSATPSATHTPSTTPSTTHTPMSTATPPPTNTPRPTGTPTPGNVEPSPTPEDIPFTPGPTSESLSCAIKLAGYGIRLRAEPGVGQAIIGVLEYGMIQQVYEWREVGLYLWAYNGVGWFATHQDDWWIYGIDGQTETCVDVPGWPDDWTPPAAIARAGTAWGVWNGPGANTSEVLVFIDELQELQAAYETREQITLGWGMNLYPVEAGRDLAARGGISEYTVWRWRLYQHQLPEGVQFIVTEAARGDGSERAVMGDISLFMVQADGELDVVTFWYNAQRAGLGHWPLAVLWGRLEELAATIIKGVKSNNSFPNSAK